MNSFLRKFRNCFIWALRKVPIRCYIDSICGIGNISTNYYWTLIHKISSWVPTKETNKSALLFCLGKKRVLNCEHLNFSYLRDKFCFRNEKIISFTHILWLFYNTLVSIKLMGGEKQNVSKDLVMVM